MLPTIEFGTDGIRGPYGIFPLDETSIIRIAKAIASFVPSGSVAIARDTRVSGPKIFQFLAETLSQYGNRVIDCGTLPTAALACVVVDDNLDLGVVITASHNPASDNGIKLFNKNGAKLSDTEQKKFQLALTKEPQKATGSVEKHIDPSGPWKRRLPTPNLQGVKILLDCAHGAASGYAETILTNCGAIVQSRASSPNGTNINLKVGALHPPADIGNNDLAICFDGDADRLILCTPEGVLDGDDILYLLKDAIEGPLIGTIMSNGGLEEALGDRLVRSAVGDKNVFQKMIDHNAFVGAEPSGHIIFRDGNMPAGDATYAALRLLSVCTPPFSLNWKRWLSHQQSVRFTTQQISHGRRPSLEDWTSMEEARCSGHRVIVRYSGTEPKLRILVEGPQALKHSNAIADEFQTKLDNI